MPIRQLKVSGVRNLQPLEITPHEGVNFIYGNNGCGKTSVLEAIALMASGKSFRTSKIQHVLNHESDRIEMFLEVDDEERGLCTMDSLR